MNTPHPLDTLAAPSRRVILEILCRTPQAAGDLARLAGISQSAASQHLKQLMQAGLVDVSRDGKQRIYRCLPAGLDQLQKYVGQLQAALAGAATRAVADAARSMAAPAAPPEDAPDAIDRAAAAYSRTWPGQDPAIYAIAIRLLMLAGHVQRGLTTTAARLDLQGGELMVLDALLQQGPPYTCTPTQLKQHMSITLAGITKRIDRLQAQGLVDRLLDPNDGRGTLVRLTGKARSLLEDIMRQQHYGTDHLAIMQLDGPRRTLLSAMLKQLLGMMDMVDQARATGKTADQSQ